MLNHKVQIMTLLAKESLSLSHLVSHCLATGILNTEIPSLSGQQPTLNIQRPCSLGRGQVVELDQGLVGQGWSREEDAPSGTEPRENMVDNGK